MRRRFLRATAGLACGIAAGAWAQTSRQAGGARGLAVAQIIDTSAGQQDVSRDFLIGARAAWQDINARGGVRGRAVQHQVLEVDGSPASLHAALSAVRDNFGCVALCGSAGDLVASQLVVQLQRERLEIAHAAPWLQNSSLQLDAQTFSIFAGRQEQIAHALKSLSVMGIQALGVVYTSQQEQAAYREDVERIAAGLQLKVVPFRPSTDLRQLGQQLNAATPAVLLFTGGTPELVQFTQGLDKQSRQRYVIALGDVNLQTLLQMGAARHTAVIATQPVPMVTASLPVVRAYRETLARLFDEPPAALSLAGFIAARYTYEVLNEVDGAPTRQSVLAAFQRRTHADLGGFRVGAGVQQRSHAYVTQSMLTADGRVIG